jgi:hypothetical protein
VNKCGLFVDVEWFGLIVSAFLLLFVFGCVSLLKNTHENARRCSARQQQQNNVRGVDHNN